MLVKRRQINSGRYTFGGTYMSYQNLNIKNRHRRCSIKKLFFKIVWRLQQRCFSVNIEKNFKNTQFEELEPLLLTNLLPNSNSCTDLIFTDQPNVVVNCGTHYSLTFKCHHQITIVNLISVFNIPLRMNGQFGI